MDHTYIAYGFSGNRVQIPASAPLLLLNHAKCANVHIPSSEDALPLPIEGKPEWFVVEFHFY